MPREVIQVHEGYPGRTRKSCRATMPYKGGLNKGSNLTRDQKADWEGKMLEGWTHIWSNGLGGWRERGHMPQWDVEV